MSFNLYSQYYDLIYDDKSTYNECLYLIDLLDKYKVREKKILEFGSGTGRHGIIFKKLGWEWEGIEQSSSMVNIASKKNLKVFQGDIVNYKLDNKYSAILSLFHVISYINENDSLINVFSNAYTHLEKGGIFIFDVWYSPAVYIQRPEKRLKIIENKHIKVTRKASPIIYWNKNIVDVNYNLTIESKRTNEKETIKETHSMRHFSLPELKLFASIVGFTWIHAEEWMTGKDIGENTWGITCIIKKV